MSRFFFPMSPFSKFLLFLVVAVLVYVLWPRTPDLARVDPAAAARHEAAAWRALKDGQLLRASKEYYLLFDRDYGFSPVRAFTLAQQATHNQRNVLSSSDPLLQETSIQRFIEHYAIFKRDLGSELDAATAGRNHFNSWAMVEAQNFTETLQTELGRLYGGLYGVAPESIGGAVKERVEALRQAFSKGEAAVDWKEVEARLRAFYEGLPLRKADEGAGATE